MQARDLGLLAGGYFLGFAAIQLPLGRWLDRHGPKRVILCFLGLAVLGCLAFSMASSFAGLLAARVLSGMGMGACLMAPLTGYRRWFSATTQLRANSWMLMTGSLGMLSSTLPVQWLLPLTGWRPLFWILALLILLAMAALAWVIPPWRLSEKRLPTASASGATRDPLHNSGEAVAVGSGWAARRLFAGNSPAIAKKNNAADRPSPADHRPQGVMQRVPSYAEVWKSRYFRKMLPIAFFNYGGMVAIQTLWAGPWMVRVAGYTPLEAATGLFYLNGCMLLTFWCWGLFNPRLEKSGWSAERLIAWCTPVSLLVLAFNIWGGASIGWLGWALFCVASSVMGLTQPAVGMAFRSSIAGRALAAYNLGIFAGVFVVQWGIGLLMDGFASSGLSQALSFQAAMAVYLCCCIASYAYFLSIKADNSPQ